MKLLSKKNILITGGSRGIGRGIVSSLIEQGANVAFTYSSSASLANEIVKELNSSKNKCKAYHSDASVLVDCEKLVDDVLNDFGSIDVLINNAGITKDNLLMRMSEVDFDKVIKVNLNSVFNMTKACLRHFLKNRNVFAAIDVFPQEPFPKNHKIRKLKNVIFSPHRAGALDSAFKEMGELVIQDLKLISKGLPPKLCKKAERETVKYLRSKPVDIN